MGKSYDMKKQRGEVKEIKQNIESKKSEGKNLERQKQELMSAMTEVSGAKLDQKVIDSVHDAINSALEANSEKGKELSTEMDNEIKSLENIKQDVMESISDAEKEKESIDKKQKLLDKMGRGGHLEKAVKELNTNIQELEELRTEVTDVQNEAMKVASKLADL